MLSMFLADNEPKDRARIILELCQSSFEMRERLKNERAIERLVENAQLNTDMIRLLCAYTLVGFYALFAFSECVALRLSLCMSLSVR